MRNARPALLWIGATTVALVVLTNCVEVLEGCEHNATCPAIGGTAGSPDGGTTGNGAGGGNGGAQSGAGGNAGSAGSPPGGAGSGGMSDGGSGGDGGGGGSNGACTETGSTANDLCIDDAHGIFVSALDGSNTTGDGTKARPFASISRALAEAAQPGALRRVYACADGGEYDESITLSAELDGLELFGGFECSGWSLDTELKSKVVSPDEIGWRVEGLTDGIRVENFDITAADASKAGGSSFGMVVRESENVVLRRVTINAGKGGAGAAGEAGAKGEDAEEVGDDQGGTAGTCDSAPIDQRGGRWDADNVCGSFGGPGGAANRFADGNAGLSGDPRANVDPPDVNNGGAAAGKGDEGSPGEVGAFGTPTTSRGTFSADGFTPSHQAASGADGFPGQGGGGGGASSAAGKSGCIGASGGAGGMGGCGGKPGTGGSGGGASVALFSWKSSVVLDACQLVANDGGGGGRGGDGGPGGLGKPGAPGGAADTSAGIAKGGAGGPGGNGGPGGAGAGGNGGPSYALVYSGSMPSRLSGTTLHFGAAGAPGPGGTAGSEKALDGSAGLKDDVFRVP